MNFMIYVFFCYKRKLSDCKDSIKFICNGCGEKILINRLITGGGKNELEGVWEG